MTIYFGLMLLTGYIQPRNGECCALSIVMREWYKKKKKKN